MGVYERPPRLKIALDWRDVVKAVIIREGIQTGIWRLSFKYDMTGMSVKWKGDQAEHVRPAAMICATEIWLVRADAEDAISVDAEKTWAAFRADVDKAKAEASGTPPAQVN